MPEEETRLLDSSEVAAMLGVSRRTLEKWVQQKKIPHVKLGTAGRGSLLRFRLDSLNAWIKSQEVASDEK
jgi:excisionase family DNA binding protein